MDGAASVITIVGLALHSTQVVYKTVSGIKHAPRTLQHLTSNLRNLSKILQQLHGFGDDLDLSSELPQLVAACAEYIGEFKAKVSKLFSPKHKKVARLWENVKATLQEDELDRMSALLQQHFEVLSLHTSVIKEYVVGVNWLRDLLHPNNLYSKRLQRIENCSKRQAALSTTDTTILENTKTGVNQVSRITGNLQTTSQASTESLSNAIDAVGDKVLNVANMSTEQSTALNSRIESVLELLKRLDLSETSQQREAKTTAREAILSSDYQEIDQQRLDPSNNELEEALTRLSSLVKEKELTLSSAKAESTIQDVDKILAHLLKAEVIYKHHDIRKKKERSCDEDDAFDVRDMQYECDVRRTKRIWNFGRRTPLYGKTELVFKSPYQSQTEHFGCRKPMPTRNPKLGRNIH